MLERSLNTAVLSTVKNTKKKVSAFPRTSSKLETCAQLCEQPGNPWLPLKWSQPFHDLLATNPQVIRKTLGDKPLLEEIRKFHAYAISAGTDTAIKDWVEAQAARIGLTDLGRTMCEAILQGKKGVPWDCFRSELEKAANQ